MLQRSIEYKAKEKYIEMVYANPAYSSQQCSKCRYISRNNRNRSTFACVFCGFKLNTDLNASRNIENKYFDDKYIVFELTQRAKCFLSGTPVIIPIVAS
ncbi:MAG: transposase [Candidatus Kariarchaeaceae archaeon]